MQGPGGSGKSLKYTTTRDSHIASELLGWLARALTKPFLVSDHWPSIRLLQP